MTVNDGPRNRDDPRRFSIFEKFAVDSAAALVFGADVDSNADPNNPFARNYFNVFGGGESWKVVLLFRMPRIFKLLGFDVLPKERGEAFSAFLSKFVADRRQSRAKVNDQLQLLVDALDDSEAKTVQADTDEPTLKSKKRMTSDDVVSQGLVFFLAGGDSIASTLTISVYLLAKHPDCQEKIVEEIDRVIAEGEVTYEKLQELEYTDAVIKETLRLYTSDPFLLRMCTKETTVWGIHFTPGMMVCIPLQALHRDPEFFPEPDSFVPERFLPENKDNVKPYTFLPFGAGPRNCIASRQALMQLKIALVCIYRKVTFGRCSRTVVSDDVLQESYEDIYVASA